MVVATGGWGAPTRQEVVDRLAAGTGAGADFAGADAPGLTVVDRDLSRSVWRAADLRGGLFRHVNLDGAVLAGASLRGALLETVSLTDADLTGVDLSGARLRLVNLAGARLDDCQLNGASLHQCMMSSTGGTHLETLRLALMRASGQTLSRAWVSALSGDAFAFVYNVQDPGFWPGTPFTVNPLLSAPALLGVEVKQRQDYFAERLLMEGDTLAEGVHILPLRSDRIDMWLMRDMPLWGLVEKRETRDKRLHFTLVQPPFAAEMLRKEALQKLWEGPWPTLEPSGALSTSAKRPLVTFTPTKSLSPGLKQAQGAFKQAAAIVGDKRSYGPLVAGEAGLSRLAGDLRRVAEAGDSDLAKRLAMWEQFPRQCLIGSRREACAFMTEALPLLPESKQTLIKEALALYQTEITLLERDWPGLNIGPAPLTAEVRGSFGKAAEIVGTVAASERQAAAIFAQIAAP